MQVKQWQFRWHHGDDDFMPRKMATTAAKVRSEPVAPTGSASCARPNGGGHTDCNDYRIPGLRNKDLCEAVKSMRVGIL
jgi:hypothetical protein